MNTKEIDTKIENLYNTINELKKTKMQRRKDGKDLYYVKLEITKTRTEIQILSYQRKLANNN